MPDAEINIATPRMKKMALNRPSAIAPTIRPVDGPWWPVFCGVGATDAVGVTAAVAVGAGVGVGASANCAAWLATSVGRTALVPSDEVALM